jgi:hypothetical protein
MDRQSIHIRLPRALHDRLVELAADQGISLNGLLVALLAGSVGFTLADEPKPKKKPPAGRNRPRGMTGT